MPNLCTYGYGWLAFSNETFQKRIKSAVKKLKAIIEENDIDAIAFTGSSGSAIAFNLASRLDIGLIYIRKPNESQNSENILECNTKKNIRKYIIVDDFICTGSTIKRIAKAIKEKCKENNVEPPDLHSVFLYDDIEPDKTIKVNKKSVPIFALKLIY